MFRRIKKRETLSFKGGGKVSVSVEDIVNSPKVQQQVAAVRKFQQSICAPENFAIASR